MAWRYPPDRLRGYFIKAWRKHGGFTQEQLAAEIGMTAPSISQMESGKQWPSQKALEAMADVFGCEPGDLLRHHPRCPIYRLGMRMGDLPEEKQQTITRVLTALMEEQEAAPAPTPEAPEEPESLDQAS